jgi:hypothetical protein
VDGAADFSDPTRAKKTHSMLDQFPGLGMFNSKGFEDNWISSSSTWMVDQVTATLDHWITQGNLLLFLQVEQKRFCEDLHSNLWATKVEVKTKTFWKAKHDGFPEEMGVFTSKFVAQRKS